MKGILGKKIGMTQVFTKNGKLIPVTVVLVEPNVVMQLKTKETDGYEAIQIGVVSKSEKHSNKPEEGHAKKANTAPKRFLKEIRGVEARNYELGQELKCDIFEAGEIVDVTGISKGKGFQGVIKRHNQSRGPMSHGSQYHRGVGSLGTLKPMHVLKGKKLPGHMGAETVTIQNLEIVSVDLENNVLLVKGNVPGNKNSFVIIKSSIKHPGAKNDKADLISYEEVVEEPIVEETVEEITEEVIEEPIAEETVEEITEEAAEEEEIEIKEEEPKEEVSDVNEDVSSEENTETQQE